MARNVNFESMLDANMRTAGTRQRKPDLDHIKLVPPSETGEKDEHGNPAHVVEMHFKQADGEYRAPEKHVFGPNNGAKLIDHLVNHGRISTNSEDLPRAEKSAQEKAQEETEEEAPRAPGSRANAAY